MFSVQEQSKHGLFCMWSVCFKLLYTDFICNPQTFILLQGKIFSNCIFSHNRGIFIFFLNYALPIICDVSPVHAQSKNEFVCSHRKQTNHIHHVYVICHKSVMSCVFAGFLPTATLVERFHPLRVLTAVTNAVKCALTVVPSVMWATRWNALFLLINLCGKKCKFNRKSWISSSAGLPAAFKKFVHVLITSET